MFSALVWFGAHCRSMGFWKRIGTEMEPGLWFPFSTCTASITHRGIRGLVDITIRVFTGRHTVL